MDQEQHPHGGDNLREIMLGLGDGLVTTLIFLFAVSAVTKEYLVVIVLGEILAGSVSMSLGGFSASRTMRQVLERRVEVERLEIETEPDEERAELYEIYRKKGFEGELLDQIIDHQTKTPERWLNAMVHDELGLTEDWQESPTQRGLIMGLAFLIGGMIPLLPFLFSMSEPRLWAYLLTCVAALVLGSMKARHTSHSALFNAIEFLIIVTIGTAAGEAIGYLLNQI